MITILIFAAIIAAIVYVARKSSQKQDVVAPVIPEEAPIVEEQVTIEEVVESVVEITVKPKRTTTKKPATQKAPIKKTARKTKKD